MNEEPGGCQARILVVDDEGAIRKILEVQLRQEGHEVVALAGAIEALELLEEDQAFDLILSDINMPDMDGFEFRRRTMEMEPVARIPFVMLTARKDSADKTTGFDLDVSAYLTKPFQREELFAQIASLLRIDLQRNEYTNEERLLAIQKLVVTIHHEINNPLTAVLGLTELLLMMPECRDTPRVRSMVEEVLGAGKRIREVVRMLGEIQTLSMKSYLPDSGVEMVDLQASSSHPEEEISESQA